MHHTRVAKARDENLYVTLLPASLHPPLPFSAFPIEINLPKLNNYRNKSAASRNEKQTSSFNYTGRGAIVCVHIVK